MTDEVSKSGTKEDAVPYESGILIAKNTGQSYAAAQGLPLRFNVEYILLCLAGLCFCAVFHEVTDCYFRINRPLVSYAPLMEQE